MGPVDSRFNAEAIEKIQPVIQFAQTIMDPLPVEMIGKTSFFLPKKPVWKVFSPPDQEAQKTELTRLIRDKTCRNLLAHGTESSYTLAQIFHDKELRLSTRHETC